MTARYRCPYCGRGFDAGDRTLNHMFGFHRRLLEERLTLSRPRTRPLGSFRVPQDPEEESGVSGEGDST